ncbi:MAG: WD40 repeat domain-containing protein [Cyanobacteria bacterium P01_F01_bin.150]
MEREKAEALLDKVERHLQQKDGKALPASQRAVLYSCLCNSNPPYEKMPDSLKDSGYGRYKWKTLKNDGYQVFKRLSNALGEDIRKNNCPRKLVDWYNHHQAETHVSEPDIRSTRKPEEEPEQAKLSDPNNQVPHDLLPFQTWKADLDDVSQAIQQRHRVVFIGGAARIGKTYFTHALMQRIRADFNIIVRYEAANVMTLGHLYQRIRHQLSKDGNDQFLNFAVPATTDDTSVIPALVAMLQSCRILLVIDHTDKFYASQQLAGCFRSEFSGYEKWLKSLLNSPSGYGCLIWVGRQPPGCFNAQYGMLKVHQVTGLQVPDAALLLRSRQLDPISSSSISPSPPNSPSDPLSNSADTAASGAEWDNANWELFVEFCGGNPAWLLVEATALERSHIANIRHFIADPSLHRSLVTILSQVLVNLAPEEYQLLCWLLLKPFSYQDIRQLESPNMSALEWESALVSLEQRCLVRQDSDQRYRINPPILAHILAQHLVQAIITDLLKAQTPQIVDSPIASLQALHTFPLLHGAASAERQNWLHKKLWIAIAHQFRQGLFQQQQIERLQSWLKIVQADPTLRSGYATSNLLNLAITLKLPLAEFDLRGLAIRHVDLRQANLHQVDFTGCWFQNVLLPLNLTGRLTAAMTPKGNAIAIGDEAGALFYWQHNEGTFRLKAIAHLPPTAASEQESSGQKTLQPPAEPSIAIEKLVFQDQNTLIVVGQQRVYSWWVDDATPPTLLTSLSAPFSCIVQSSIGRIAIGLTNGAIVLWDDMCSGIGARADGDRPQPLIAHRNAISHLAFSPDGCALMSICESNQGLIWDLRPWPRSAPSYQEWPVGINLCWDMRWTWNGQLRAEADPMSTYIKVRREAVVEQIEHTDPLFINRDTGVVSWKRPSGQLTGLSFDPNGSYLSGSSLSQNGDGSLFCWNWQTGAYRVIQRSNCYGTVLTTCSAGRLMLVAQGMQIQIFNLEQRELIWQVASLGNKQQNGAPGSALSETNILVKGTLDKAPVPLSINLQQVQGLSEIEKKQLQTASFPSSQARGQLRNLHMP